MNVHANCSNCKRPNDTTLSRCARCRETHSRALRGYEFTDKSRATQRRYNASGRGYSRARLYRHNRRMERLDRRGLFGGRPSAKKIVEMMLNIEIPWVVVR